MKPAPPVHHHAIAVPNVVGGSNSSSRHLYRIVLGLGIGLVLLQVGTNLATIHHKSREIMVPFTTLSSDSSLDDTAADDDDDDAPTQFLSSSRSSGSRDDGNSVIVDILSIGSKRRPELLAAQQESFGSHISVRHFFTATEDDDEDPHCEETLSEDNVYDIGKFCKQKPWDPERQPFMRHMKNRFANIAWLKRKENAPGWMCAQRRPVHGLYKVMTQFFQQSSANDNNNDNNAVVLPDHLIVMDDDTYYNIDAALSDLIQDPTPDIPLVTAGCLVREPIHEFNFTFGFGGFGIIFNKASLEYMMQPIQCPRDTALCDRIQNNQLGEALVFQNGMSLIELMQSHAEHEPYREVSNWTDGYCMHSDWTIGYYVNYYNISRHTVADSFYKDVPQNRIEVWRDSELYRGPEGFCRNSEVENCPHDAVMCHYMTPDAMRNLTNLQKQKAPERYRETS